MSVPSKHHRPDKVTAMVSQSSRNDAKPVTGMRFETYSDERDHWAEIVRKLNEQLSGYSKMSFAREQARIRRENAADKRESVRLWHTRKSTMESERLHLIGEKSKAETQLMRLKPLVAAEKSRRHQETMVADASKTAKLESIGMEILEELREIKLILTERDPKIRDLQVALAQTVPETESDKTVSNDLLTELQTLRHEAP